MNTKRIINVELVQTLVDYLAGRPFREVHNIIGALMTLPLVHSPKPPDSLPRRRPKKPDA